MLESMNLDLWIFWANIWIFSMFSGAWNRHSKISTTTEDIRGYGKSAKPRDWAKETNWIAEKVSRSPVFYYVIRSEWFCIVGSYHNLSRSHWRNMLVYSFNSFLSKCVMAFCLLLLWSLYMFYSNIVYNIIWSWYEDGWFIMTYCVCYCFEFYEH